MHKQLTVNGEDLVGLLGLVSDEYAVLSVNFPDASILGVPVYKTAVYGTNLIGLFCVGNSNGILVPYFVDKDKREKIKKDLKALGVDVNVGVVHDLYTALGNMVCANDKVALVSPKMKETKVFEDTLGVEVVKTRIAKHDEVGSCCIATNKGFLVHPEAEEELKELGKVLKVPGREGTVNYGFPYVKTGLLANSTAYITGLRTSGIELGRIDDALGFM